MDMMAVNPIAGWWRRDSGGRAVDADPGGAVLGDGRVRRWLITVVVIGVDDGAFWSRDAGSG